MFDVQIVDIETIQPSSPIPENLRYLQLSMVAQIMPPGHIPYILYYSGAETAGKSNRLKKSLSKVLTRFYPLAGRIKHEDDDASLAYTHVECNDQGVDFYEARVNGLLSEFLGQPLTDEPSQLLPYATVSTVVPLSIQLSVFECGGFAIGFLVSQILVDLDSLFMFIRSWAEATRGDVQKVVLPVFGVASFFPARRGTKNRWMQEELTSLPEEKKAKVAKELVFESAEIALLRERVYTRAGFFPTCVEVVSALIWRCMIRSLGEERKPVAMHPVNIRGRVEPPISEHSFGNLVIPVFVTGERYRLGCLEEKLREAIGETKGDRIKQMLEKEVEKGVNDSMWDLGDDGGKCGFDLVVFAYLDKVYESDFGWGKPEKFCIGTVPGRNAVVLVPAKDGDGGMEALVVLEKGEMAKFEHDLELLAFASIKNHERMSNITTLPIRGRL